MGVFDVLTLPARLAVSATEATLALGQLVAAEGPIRRKGGYAERVMLIIGEDGLVERLSAVLSDPKGPMALVNTLAAATAQDRPLGRAMAPNGPVDRLLEEEGLLDRLLSEEGFVEKLVAEGGTLDQLVALGATLEEILPRLAELSVVVPELHESVDTLSDAVGPLGELAGRLPRARRRPAVDA